jgi:hypothetical protein
MIQLNFNVSGEPGDDPVTLQVDTGHTYPLTPDIPGRMVCKTTQVEPSPFGASVVWREKVLGRLVIPPDGWVGEAAGVIEGSDPPMPACTVNPLRFSGGGTGLEPIIVDDHFEMPDAPGQEWVYAMTDGFIDYKVFLDGGDVRSLWAQNQDLGAHGRRIFGIMKNIADFRPEPYGDSYYARLPEFCALAWEYGQRIEFDVLCDTQYWDYSLGWCQTHWARVCDALAPVPTRFVSLTNEYDHGGNLVGTPNDYHRPGFALVSQGSAVSDAPPPRPGWGWREWHNLRDYPKCFLFEDMFYNRDGVDADGHVWGPHKPTVLTECNRFDEITPHYDERLARQLAYQSLAFGSGMCVHTEDGKWSRLLGPRQQRCVRVVMDILNRNGAS